jgi:uridine kinase
MDYNLSMTSQNTTQNIMVVGIAGGTGSGKTTLADLILRRMGPDRIGYLPHDAYYREQRDLPLEERAKVNYDHPDSLETELLIKHIQALMQGQAIDMPVYDFTIHNRKAETVRVEPRPVILVEGILIFVEKQLRDLFEMKIYVDTDADIRFIRRLTRDMGERDRTLNSVVDQYLSTVRPMHMEFVEASKRYADIIVPQGGMNPVALEMVIARLQTLMSGEIDVDSQRNQSAP